MGECLDFELYHNSLGSKGNSFKSNKLSVKTSDDSSDNLAQLVVLPKVVDGNRYDFSYLPEYLRTRYNVTDLDFVVNQKRITEQLECWKEDEFEHYQVKIFGYRNQENARVVIDNLHLMKIPVELFADSFYLSKAKEQMIGILEDRAKFFSSCGFNVDVYWTSRKEKPIFQAHSKEYPLFELRTIQM